jgi:hypothetical protein
MRPAVELAHQRTIAALPPRERAAFLASLVRLVEANNERGRTKLRIGRRAVAVWTRHKREA